MRDCIKLDEKALDLFSVMKSTWSITNSRESKSRHFDHVGKEIVKIDFSSQNW